MNNFSIQLKEVKKASEDFEFYPTTNEILEVLAARIEERNFYEHPKKFLDIGAGNGKVLNFMRDKNLFNQYYAIEKSQTHLSGLDPSYYILGVDFWKTTLIDKGLTAAFSNPPYSEYEKWTSKILEETKSGVFVYLVIPERWRNSDTISQIIKRRGGKFDVLGRFDFLEAEDRPARAKVELVEFQFPKIYDEKDPFQKFFDDNFSYPEAKEKVAFEKEVENCQLVNGTNLIETLCFLHDDRMAKLEDNFKAVCSLDRELLEEFSISRESLIESLKMKIADCKKQFWQRLFDGMDTIKTRLTHDSRKKIYTLMNDNTGIEFNRENCYAVVIWVIKNANQYFDSQFIDLYESMVDFANIENYKSNQRVFKEHEFRYRYERYERHQVSHFRLKVGHRIVLDRCGGLYRSPYSLRDEGLSEHAANFIGDIMTIANNLGFTPIEGQPRKGAWDTSEAQTFNCIYKGEKACLFKVRAFYNGNMHFQFMPEFIHAMNIQFGKNKGWIGARNAAEETGCELELAKEFFSKSFHIGPTQLTLR